MLGLVDPNMDPPLASELPQFYQTFWNSESLVQPVLGLRISERSVL
jgi:hypothetical protein